MYYARGRPGACSLRRRADVDSRCSVLLQVVRTNAKRLHCHSGPSAVLATGSWAVNPIESSATTQAADEIAVMSMRALRLQSLGGMQSFLFDGAQNSSGAVQYPVSEITFGGYAAWPVASPGGLDDVAIRAA